jgi:hypothetical protein
MRQPGAQSHILDTMQGMFDAPMCSFERPEPLQ